MIIAQYCPRCGYITSQKFYRHCQRCLPKYEIETLDIPDKYELSMDKTFKISDEEWERRKRFFYEDYLLKHTNIDPSLYWEDKKAEDERVRNKEKKDYEELQALIKNKEAKIQQSNPAGVKCAYCGSNNCKKISGLARSLSVGLFGLKSRALGKQWHCNNCGSDF